MRGGAGVKLLSYCDGEAPGGRSLCVLNCQKVMEGHPAAHPHKFDNQQLDLGERNQRVYKKYKIQKVTPLCALLNCQKVIGKFTIS